MCSANGSVSGRLCGENTSQGGGAGSGEGSGSGSGDGSGEGSGEGSGFGSVFVGVGVITDGDAGVGEGDAVNDGEGVCPAVSPLSPRLPHHDSINAHISITGINSNIGMRLFPFFLPVPDIYDPPTKYW